MQVMGDLPDHHFAEVHPDWSCVNMDLYGTLEIRNEVVKRGPKVCKKKFGEHNCIY